MANIGAGLLLIYCFTGFMVMEPAYSESNTLVQGQQLKDAQYLASASGNCMLGFFSGCGRKRYVGIWHKQADAGNARTYLNPLSAAEYRMNRYARSIWNEQDNAGYLRDEKPVWVANRNTPISDNSGILTISNDGHVKILHDGGVEIVLFSVPLVNNASATLPDSGNFVVHELNSDGSIKQALWQSFDYPTDTLLLGMKIGINTKTGHHWSLTSWSSEKDPASGSFKLGMDPNNTNQLIIWWQGEIYWVVIRYIGCTLGYGYEALKVILTCEQPSFYDGCFGRKYGKCFPGKGFTASKGIMLQSGFKFNERDKLTLNDCQAMCMNYCFCNAYASTNDDETGCEIWDQWENFLKKNSDDYRYIYFRQLPYDFESKGSRVLFLCIITAIIGGLFILALSYYFVWIKFRAKAKPQIWITIKTIGGLIVLMFRSIYYVTQEKLRSFGAILEMRGLARFGAGDCSNGSYPGCVKQQLPACRKPNDQFEQRKGVMSGEGFKFDGNHNLSLFDCWAKCLNNCSCIAYAATDYNQTSCTIWSKGVNFKESNNSYSMELYFLVPKKATMWWIWLVLSMTGILVLLVCCLLYNFIQRKCKEKGERKAEQEILQCELGASTSHASIPRKRKLFEKDRKKSSALEFFSFESIAEATNNFATTNKLGEGGFGPVYTGILANGQEVAIKRLSESSGQGVVEFKNELVLIAKLQYTNLVRIVGFCIQREEKILIYEYMHKKSLDFLLFDPTKNDQLDWKKHFKIIEGIAQGLLYLHKYSRLRIVHRDLKASNILLDVEMNPKISDFGMARIFGQDESEANTKRVVGTYGYMSPEYAIKGTFSMKSDVFSFGVLLNGKKNNNFCHREESLNLLGYAWELRREGKCLEVADPTLDDSYPLNDVLRCIHIGLLCVQDSPIDRPSMSDVVSRITNETVSLVPQKQLGFFINTSLSKTELENFSINKVSVSKIEAR